MGLFGGLLAYILLPVFSPYIRNLVNSLAYSNTGLIKAEIENIIKEITSSVPDPMALIYAPFIGLIISILAGIFITVYLLKIPINELLKEM